MGIYGNVISLSRRATSVARLGQTLKARQGHFGPVRSRGKKFQGPPPNAGCRSLAVKSAQEALSVQNILG